MAEEEKRIVCLYGEEKRGKTQTLKMLAEILLGNDPSKADKWIHPNPVAREKFSKLANISEWPNDICVEMTVEGKRIGLNSDGDDPGTIRKRLEAMAENCGIIFCACRAGDHDYWGTLAALKETAQAKNCTVVYTSPYTDDRPPSAAPTCLQKELNRKKAGHLKDFISWDNG